MSCRTILGVVCLVGLLVITPLPAHAADPPLIRFGHGFAAEEQVWLMAARPELAHTVEQPLRVADRRHVRVGDE